MADRAAVDQMSYQLAAHWATWSVRFSDHSRHRILRCEADQGRPSRHVHITGEREWKMKKKQRKRQHLQRLQQQTEEVISGVEE